MTSHPKTLLAVIEFIAHGRSGQALKDVLNGWRCLLGVAGSLST